MVRIGKYTIGSGQPCFLIAEAGVNHNGSLDTARRLVELARRAGANAVKFQTFKADRLATTAAPKAAYQERTTDTDESQHEMLRRLELSADAHRSLAEYCASLGILFMSTPFDEESADFLADLGVPAFKIPSGEINNLPLLAHVASKGKPLILSTGMAWLGEVERAVSTVWEAGNLDVVLLHCVSSYPAAPADVNLRAMETMSKAFGVPVGFSDHTLGIDVALAAVALGASVVEKHFTIDRGLPGPDHHASLSPDDLEALVWGVRNVEAALGDGRKVPVAGERDTAVVVRKSLVIARDVPAGTRLTDQDIAFKRPGTGLSPAMKPCVVGRTTRVDIAAGTLVALEMLA